jgi:hypothetical protein
MAVAVEYAKRFDSSNDRASRPRMSMSNLIMVSLSSAPPARSVHVDGLELLFDAIQGLLYSSRPAVVRD